jgi:hypothetical protein
MYGVKVQNDPAALESGKKSVNGLPGLVGSGTMRECRNQPVTGPAVPLTVGRTSVFGAGGDRE